jgi:hypothetical protein
MGWFALRRGQPVARSAPAQRGHRAPPRGHPTPAQRRETQPERLPALVQRGMAQLFVVHIQNRRTAGDRGRLSGVQC